MDPKKSNTVSFVHQFGAVYMSGKTPIPVIFSKSLVLSLGVEIEILDLSVGKGV